MIKKLILPMALGALLTANATAGTVTLSDAPGRTGNGGEFNAQTSDNGDFKTFCIEHNENITLPGTYDYVISGGAINGGVNGGQLGQNPDKISIGTAYLFRNFHDETLSNVAAVPYTHIGQQQLDLQEAIWWLEGEIDLTTPQANQYLKKAYSVIGGAADYSDLKADGNGAYQVYAMNLTSNNGAVLNQDQLIVVPDGGMTLAMLGMACASFGLLRRKL